MRELKDIPRSHRQLRGRFAGAAPDGTGFVLELVRGKRRANSGELVREHIRSMTTRGRPLSHPVYVETEELVLKVQGRRPEKIDIMPGGYRCGRRSHRYLGGLVEILASDMGLVRHEPSVPGGP